MPAYNGIRGYWNEVRVNSNYKSKNAVPQGTELEAGMQTKMEKSRYGFWKPGFLFATLFFADRKSTRLNSSHEWISRMPSSA